jgi:hypothetical protein
MGTFNAFGATTTALIALFPGTVAADFGGTSAIQAVLDRIAREVAGALAPKAYHALAEQVELEMVEDYAADGQTAFTLGLTPSIAGTLHMWRFGRDAILRTKPRMGWSEMTVTSHTVATGAVVVSDTLVVGDKVFATYEIDPEAAAFSWPSVADAVLMGAAAELGSRLYTAAEQQSWALVMAYQAKYAGSVGSIGDDGVLRLARAGRWMPDELRTLRFWTEIDVAGASVGSIDLLRG